MELEPDVPSTPAVIAVPPDSGAPDSTGVNAADASHTAGDSSSVPPDGAAADAPDAPDAPNAPDHQVDQATVLDLRRAQPANGAAAPRTPLQTQDAEEPLTHDAATYQDVPAGAASAWRVPSTPPYVPAQSPRQLPHGVLPTPRSHAPWRTAQSWGPTTFVISADTAAGFSYLLWWLTGLTVYFAERNNRYVRFHALQAILLTSVFTVLGVLTFVLDALLHDVARATHWTVFAALGNGVAVLVVVLGIVVPWLGTMIGAWTGHHIRWPIVGAYAERYAAPPLQVSGTPF